MAVSDQPKPTAGTTQVLEPTPVGRYLVFDEIGVGGMATVHLGLLSGAVGFRRIVAIKQLHAQFVNDPDFCAQFVDEARLAARILHPNVVQTLDVVWAGDELALVLEYLDGDTLGRVLKSAVARKAQIPVEIACGILSGVLHGLHAAHQARDEQGNPLNIVHRDVSPQNILIGRDGLARVLDFGVARAAARIQTTQAGLIKGKFGYMAPEQIKRVAVDCRTDVFAAGIVLWETLTCQRLFQVQGKVEKVLERIISAEIPKPSTLRPELPSALDAIVEQALQKAPEARFQSAEEFAVALEQAVRVASPRLIRGWFEPLASDDLIRRAQRIDAINRHYSVSARTPVLQSSKRTPPATRKPVMDDSQVTVINTALDMLTPDSLVPEPTTTRSASLRLEQDRGRGSDELTIESESPLTKFGSSATWLPRSRRDFTRRKVALALGLAGLAAALVGLMSRTQDSSPSSAEDTAGAAAALGQASKGAPSRPADVDDSRSAQTKDVAPANQPATLTNPGGVDAPVAPRSEATAPEPASSESTSDNAGGPQPASPPPRKPAIKPAFRPKPELGLRQHR